MWSNGVSSTFAFGKSASHVDSDKALMKLAWQRHSPGMRLVVCEY
jgi:hypothetical protein